MSNKTPFVTDEQIREIAKGYATEGAIRYNRELQHLFNAAYLSARELSVKYEAELSRKDAEIEALREELRAIDEANAGADL
jgi:hypothetical protein